MQDAYETPYDRFDTRVDRLDAMADQLEAMIDRLDATCHRLDCFGRARRRGLLVLLALHLASTSLIGYVAVQIGSGHRW